MTLYAIEPKKNTILVILIIEKYTDTQSLIQLFSILKVIYNFNPYSVTIDLDLAQIKAIKNCDKFTHKPYAITCLCHLGQALIKKMKF